MQLPLTNTRPDASDRPSDDGNRRRWIIVHVRGEPPQATRGENRSRHEGDRKTSVRPGDILPHGSQREWKRFKRFRERVGADEERDAEKGETVQGG